MPSLTERFQGDLLAWTQENLREFPWRDEEATAYEVLVAEMFLNVTRTDVVARIYPKFIERFPDPASILDAEREDIIDIIRPLGLYNHRADALMELATTLHEAGVPKTEEALMELPRVGRYVANAILCMTYDEDRPMMDRNVARVYSRVFGMDIDEDAPGEEAWVFADDLVPEGHAMRYNLGLIDFASATCKASNPDCETCFASGYCSFAEAHIGDG